MLGMVDYTDYDVEQCENPLILHFYGDWDMIEIDEIGAMMIELYKSDETLLRHRHWDKKFFKVMPPK